MGTSISFMPTTGFDIYSKKGQTRKVITRSQCITTMMVYENKSLEELRFEDYQLGRRRRKGGYGTSLYRFEQTWLSEIVMKEFDHMEWTGKMQSITAMKEYKNASFEELRLEDYREGRGPKFNQLTVRSESIFSKVFQPNSQPPNDTVYCNLINNLNITLPSVNFLGAPSQQRQIINAKRKLQHNFKNIKTANTIISTLRLPQTKSGALNKSLDTVMSTVAQVGKVENNNDYNVNTANTSCNNGVSNVSECNVKGKVLIGLENNEDADIVIGNETILQGRGDLTTVLEKVDVSSGKVAINSDKDAFGDNESLAGDIDKTINNAEPFYIDSRETSPNEIKTDAKNMDCSNDSAKKDDCEFTSENITITSNPSISCDKKNNIIILDKDAGNETSLITKHNNVIGEVNPKDSQECEQKLCDTNTDAEEGMLTIDDSQYEDNSETAATADGTVMNETDNINRECNDLIDFTVNNNFGVKSENENSNEMARNITSLDNDNDIEPSNSFKSNTSKTHDGTIDKGLNDDEITKNIAIDLEKQALSTSSSDSIDHNNMTEDETEILRCESNYNDNNDIVKPNDLFRFGSQPKPRIIVKPSKLQNIIAFKTPNSINSSKGLGTLSRATITVPTKSQTEHSPKSIFSGYPFMNPNTTKRFNFAKSTDSDRETTLNAHLQIFSNNNQKPDPVNIDNNLAAARYIRKFTPFSFQKPDTDNSTNTAIFTTPANKTASSPFIRVSFAQKRTTPHPNIVHSSRGATIALNVSEPNTSSISNTSSILSTSNNIPPSKFPTVNSLQPFSFSSTITNTSVASALIKSPSLIIKPATFKNTAFVFPIDFGVDIINYGASTSKQCTAEESISLKGDIAPSFKDLSVTNDTDLGLMQSESNETTMTSAILPKLPTSMSVDELSIEESDRVNANHQISVIQSSDSQEFNSQSNSLTEAKPETVSAFKGSSVPSLFKGKGLLKKSTMVNSSLPSNSTNLEFNKPSLDSLLISPQKESSLGSASRSADASEYSTFTSSALPNLVKNPFYLGPSEETTIKKKIVIRRLSKQQLKLANSTAAKRAFILSQSAKVSDNLSLDTTDSGVDSKTSISSPLGNVLESNTVSNSSVSKCASPSIQTVSTPSDVSLQIPQSSPSHVSFQIPRSFPSPNVSSQTPQSSQSPNAFRISQSSSSSMQLKNTIPESTFSYFDDVNASSSQNIPTSPSNPTSIFNILNTESLHPLVLHRQRHRYRDMVFNNGLVINASNHPRYLYLFSAIPVIINQIFTIKVTELFHKRNNDVVIGFTAVDPCVLNVFELPEDPMLLLDRLEYWVFEKFKFQTNDEIKFQIKTNGDVEFYKNFRYTTSFFVDTTITLWLFVYVNNAIRAFSLKTNEQIDLSVIEAMDMPVEIDIDQPMNAVRQNNETNMESHLDNSTSNIIPESGSRHVTRNYTINGRVRGINNAQQRNLNLPLFEPTGFQSGSPEGQNLQPRAYDIAQDRLGLYRNEVSGERINDFIDRNSNREPQFSNVSNRAYISWSNQTKNAKQSNKPGNCKSKRQERDNECIICCDKVIDCVLYTCGHSCMCLECGMSIMNQGDAKCPICRKMICDVIRIYKS